MRLIVLLVVLALHLLFGLLNTTPLLATSDINLGFAQYTGPLGLILLCTSALVALLAYLVSGLSSLRREADAARMLRDMDSLRQSLDTQEASRFAQLQASLDQRFTRLDGQLTQPRAAYELTSGAGNLSQKELSPLSAAQLERDLAELSAYLRRKLGD